MAVDADFMTDHTKQPMAKSVRNQGLNADSELGSFIRAGAHRPGGIVPEMVNKSVEGTSLSPDKK